MIAPESMVDIWRGRPESTLAAWLPAAARNAATATRLTDGGDIVEG